MPDWKAELGRSMKDAFLEMAIHVLAFVVLVGLPTLLGWALTSGSGGGAFLGFVVGIVLYGVAYLVAILVGSVSLAKMVLRAFRS